MQDWTPEQKRKVEVDHIIHRHLKGDLNQTDAAATLGVSQPTFSRMLQKYAQSSNLDRGRRYDLAPHIIKEFGITLQVLVPAGGETVEGIPAQQWVTFRPDKVSWPAGPIWLCPPFNKTFAATYFIGIRKAVAKGSTVICACPESWQDEPWVTEGVAGILTPLGNYHVRRYTAQGKKTRYCGRVLVLRYEPGNAGRYTNTIPAP